MPVWKRNLIVCWFGMFVTGVGMSQLAPVLPLYIQQLGVDNADSVAQLSGLAFGITYIISAIFSPIWGMAADKVGRKPMLLRASLGMALIIGCMGFAQHVYVLIGLRLLQGLSLVTAPPVRHSLPRRRIRNMQDMRWAPCPRRISPVPCWDRPSAALLPRIWVCRIRFCDRYSDADCLCLDAGLRERIVHP